MKCPGYVRYNAELSRQGLDALGLKNLKPGNVQKLDSVEHIKDLRRVGKAVAKQAHKGHFKTFP